MATDVLTEGIKCMEQKVNPDKAILFRCANTFYSHGFWFEMKPYAFFSVQILNMKETFCVALVVTWLTDD